MIQRRLELFDGVSIKVVSKCRGYSILIKIEEGAYLWQERQNEHCAIKFIIPYKKRIAQKSYKIKVNNQGYNHTKLGAPFRRNFDLPSGGTCLVYLSPTLFLTEELVSQCQDTIQKIDVNQKTSQQLLFAPLTKKVPKTPRRPRHYKHQTSDI